MLYNSRQPDQAIASYLKAVQLRPRFAEAHYNLGQIYHEQGDKAKAIAHLQRAIAINPKYEAAILALAKLQGTK